MRLNTIKWFLIITLLSFYNSFAQSNDSYEVAVAFVKAERVGKNYGAMGITMTVPPAHIGKVVSYKYKLTITIVLHGDDVVRKKPLRLECNLKEQKGLRSQRKNHKIVFVEEGFFPDKFYKFTLKINSKPNNWARVKVMEPQKENSDLKAKGENINYIGKSVYLN